MQPHAQPATQGRHHWLWAAVLAASAAVCQAQPAAGASYADIAPILAQRCVMCHTGDAAPAGLRLDSFEALMKGGTKGALVKAGDAAGSELIRRLKGQALPRMPMTGPPFLSDAEIARFERWVNAGLPKGKVTAAATPPPPAASRPAPGQPVTYLHVAPILAARCAKCHTDQGLMGPAPEGYRLNSYAATLASRERARVVPGQPGASELLRRIRGQARPRMPMDGPPYLSADETRLIEDWIAQGARDSQGRPAPMPAGTVVRLHGALDVGGQLDGQALAIGPHTRIDKSPRAGDYVEVRGRLDAAGNVSVERLRPR